MSLNNLLTWIVSFILGTGFVYGLASLYNWAVTSGLILKIYPYLFSLIFVSPFVIFVVKPLVDNLVNNLQQIVKKDQ